MYYYKKLCRPHVECPAPKSDQLKRVPRNLYAPLHLKLLYCCICNYFYLHPFFPPPHMLPCHNTVPPTRWETQGLQMHGTTILCVRKNGKVVSRVKRQRSLLAKSARGYTIGCTLFFPPQQYQVVSVRVVVRGIANMATGEPGSSMGGAPFFSWACDTAVLLASCCFHSGGGDPVMCVFLFFFLGYIPLYALAYFVLFEHREIPEKGPFAKMRRCRTGVHPGHWLERGRIQFPKTTVLAITIPTRQ